MLNETKEDLEYAQSRLSKWLALVKVTKDDYDMENHVKDFVDIDPELLTDQFDELKSVCEAYIAECITIEKNEVTENLIIS